MNKPIDITDVVLKTGRLTLRPWEEKDVQDMFAYARVDGVGQMAGWTPHADLEESARIVQMFIAGRKTFALEFEGRVIGSLGIEEYNLLYHPELDDKQGREIGYVLSKEYWGRGLMPEAVAAVIGYLFDAVGLDFIIVGHFVWNSQSRRVVEKCGFRFLRAVTLETRCGTQEETLDYILWNPNRREE